MMGINSHQQLYYYYLKTTVNATTNHLNISLTPISDAAMAALLDSL